MVSLLRAIRLGRETTDGITLRSIQLRKYLSHRSQLDDVAAAHRGIVGLHRRLFGQWLHHMHVHLTIACC